MLCIGGVEDGEEAFDAAELGEGIDVVGSEGAEEEGFLRLDFRVRWVVGGWMDVERSGGGGGGGGFEGEVLEVRMRER